MAACIVLAEGVQILLSSLLPFLILYNAEVKLRREFASKLRARPEEGSVDTSMHNIAVPVYIVYCLCCEVLPLGAKYPQGMARFWSLVLRRDAEGLEGVLGSVAPVAFIGSTALFTVFLWRSLSE